MEQRRTAKHYLLLSLLALQVVATACTLPSTRKEALRTIATADSLDNTHQLYSDTVALRLAIRALNKPISRDIHRNALASAYYYMGRNLSNANAITEATDCYIACDRLHPDDLILRGRVNACMAYICSQQSEDSLALCFYQRSSEAFCQSSNDWYYAHSLLNICERYCNLHLFHQADSVWRLADTFLLDNAYSARLLETRGLYFYEQQRYDSALTYFFHAQTFSTDTEAQCYTAMKIIQSYESQNLLHMALPYAEYIIAHSHNPNFLSNAYYCIIAQAEYDGDFARGIEYTHLREDNTRLLTQRKGTYAQAVLKLQNYLAIPYSLHPWKINICIIFFFCTILLGMVYYRKRCLKRKDIQLKEAEKLLSRQTVSLQQHLDTIQELSKTISIDRTPDIMEHIAHFRSQHPQPDKSWLDYPTLKNAVCSTLPCFCTRLERLQLNEKEIIVCIHLLIYNNFTLNQLANSLCYAPNSIRTIKGRIAKKVGVNNATNLYNFLLNLAIYGTPIQQ